MAWNYCLGNEDRKMIENVEFLLARNIAEKKEKAMGPYRTVTNTFDLIYSSSIREGIYGYSLDLLVSDKIPEIHLKDWRVWREKEVKGATYLFELSKEIISPEKIPWMTSENGRKYHYQKLLPREFSSNKLLTGVLMCKKHPLEGKTIFNIRYLISTISKFPTIISFFDRGDRYCCGTSGELDAILGFRNSLLTTGKIIENKDPLGFI